MRHYAKFRCNSLNYCGEIVIFLNFKVTFVGHFDFLKFKFSSVDGVQSRPVCHLYLTLPYDDPQRDIAQY